MIPFSGQLLLPGLRRSGALFLPEEKLGEKKTSMKLLRPS